MKIKGLRWWIVGLVALATVINYIDRQAFGALWPDMGVELFPDLDEDGRKAIFGIINTVFILSYAFGQALFGKIFDWIGSRIGFTLSIGIWSLATVMHAFAKGLISFSIFRSILGIAEAGNWPGAAKSNAEWFPINERAFAQGIFNSGAAVGGIISYPIIGLLNGFLAWQSIFIVVGIIGLLWLIPWLYLMKAPPEKHPWLTEEEKNYILTGQEMQEEESATEKANEYNPATGKLLSHKQSWGVIIASASIDPIWWLFIIWIPVYLSEKFGMNVKEIAFSAWVPFVGAMVGAWFGGLLAQNFLKKGKGVNFTRKFTITLGCLIMLPALLSLSNPAKPSVLTLFDVDPVTAENIVSPEVTAMLADSAFLQVVKDEQFINRLEGQSITTIKQDADVLAALDGSKLELSPTDQTLSALGRLNAIGQGKKVAAYIAIFLMTLILFGFQTAIGNVQTLPSDFFSGKTVGTLSGFSGMAAKLTAAGLTALVPVLTEGGNYTPAFIIGASLALIAMGSVWFLCGEVKPLKPDE
ncbi:MAG: MFS transporter [Bacteroidota bacterium]